MTPFTPPPHFRNAFLDWPDIQEPELVPYRPLGVLAVKSLLVMAPHPDDEVFGCGGLLALAAQQGVHVHVLVATDGAGAGDPKVREAESRAAARALGLDERNASLRFWQLPDRGLRPDAALSARLLALWQELQPGWVLAPSPLEVHPDHRALCRAAVQAWPDWSGNGAARLGFYEVGQPLLPSELVDITSVWVRKEVAMASFASQLSMQRYDQQIAALNRYRAYTLGPAVTHAEALWFPSAQACTSPHAMWQALADLVARRMGAPATDHPERA
jgi:LmbE family N-acetylglucosaminyl deacetylase